MGMIKTTSTKIKERKMISKKIDSKVEVRW